MTKRRSKTFVSIARSKKSPFRLVEKCLVDLFVRRKRRSTLIRAARKASICSFEGRFGGSHVHGSQDHPAALVADLDFRPRVPPMRIAHRLRDRRFRPFPTVSPGSSPPAPLASRPPRPETRRGGLGRSSTPKPCPWRRSRWRRPRRSPRRAAASRCAPCPTGSSGSSWRDWRRGSRR